MRIDGQCEGSPDEPCTAGTVGAVLSPGTEVMPACDALPACPPNGEIGLPGEVLLRSPAIPVAQICVVYVAKMQSQTLVRVPDRPAVRAMQQQKGVTHGDITGESGVVLLCVLAKAVFGKHEGVGQPREDHIERLAKERCGELQSIRSMVTITCISVHIDESDARRGSDRR